MATKGKKAESESDVQAVERSEPVTYGPPEGGNILAAWQGLYNLFGARAERFDVTPDGVVAVNVSFESNFADPGTIVAAITQHGDKRVNRRLDLVELFPYVQDPENVESFTKSEDMTAWMVQNTKGYGDGDGSRSPQWVKDAITDYKDGKSIAAPRGRKRRIIRLDNLREIKPETLADTELSELQALQETIQRAVAERQNAGMAAGS